MGSVRNLTSSARVSHLLDSAKAGVRSLRGRASLQDTGNTTSVHMFDVRSVRDETQLIHVCRLTLPWAAPLSGAAREVLSELLHVQPAQPMSYAHILPTAPHNAYET